LSRKNGNLVGDGAFHRIECPVLNEHDLSIEPRFPRDILLNEIVRQENDLEHIQKWGIGIEGQIIPT
jgi:hypothetical protein